MAKLRKFRCRFTTVKSAKHPYMDKIIDFEDKGPYGSYPEIVAFFNTCRIDLDEWLIRGKYNRTPTYDGELQGDGESLLPFEVYRFIGARVNFYEEWSKEGDRMIFDFVLETDLTGASLNYLRSKIGSKLYIGGDHGDYRNAIQAKKIGWLEPVDDECDHRGHLKRLGIFQDKQGPIQILECSKCKELIKRQIR